MKQGYFILDHYNFLHWDSVLMRKLCRCSCVLDPAPPTQYWPSLRLPPCTPLTHRKGLSTQMIGWLWSHLPGHTHLLARKGTSSSAWVGVSHVPRAHYHPQLPTLSSVSSSKQLSLGPPRVHSEPHLCIPIWVNCKCWSSWQFSYHNPYTIITSSVPVKIKCATAAVSFHTQPLNMIQSA